MPIVPLYGHESLRERLTKAATLPASLLFHGPKGVGKQRLALWLGQRLLCTGVLAGPEPCRSCKSCRYAESLAHPDLHWYFPRPRLKDSDADTEAVRADYVDAIAERLKVNGIYAPPSGTEGIFVATVRALLKGAALSPALGQRKVFIVGDAERMVSQEGADMAANAFLKLLEEPLPDTQLILTSSEPGALLPTIRSRVASVRVPILSDGAVRLFLADPLVSAALERERVPSGVEERVQLASGAPGSLFGATSRESAVADAERFLKAAVSPDPTAAFQLALSQGASKARGAFTDTLAALTVLLHRRSLTAVRHSDSRLALGAANAIGAVERAKERAHGNVNPQLLGAALIRELREALR